MFIMNFKYWSNIVDLSQDIKNLKLQGVPSLRLATIGNSSTALCCAGLCWSNIIYIYMNHWLDNLLYGSK